ncbi:MAG: xanthine dehydrogenase family protein subunit M [Pyrobaculum sp.]
MFPPSFEYVRASSLEEAVRILSGVEGAKALAGGQSLIPLLKLRLLAPPLVVDIGRLRGLDYVEYGEWVRIGALARHYQLEDSPCRLLKETARRIGDPQIRSLGTVGGSVAHADPYGDWPAVFLAADAVFEVRGPSGVREAAAEDFFKGPYETALAQGELVTEIRLRCPPRGAYVKFSRRHNDFALAAVAVAAEVKDGHVVWARVAALGAGEGPRRLKKTEAFLEGAPLTRDVVAEAGDVAAKEAEPPSDVRASAEHRRALIKAGVRRALAGL